MTAAGRSEFDQPPSLFGQPLQRKLSTVHSTWSGHSRCSLPVLATRSAWSGHSEGGPLPVWPGSLAGLLDLGRGRAGTQGLGWIVTRMDRGRRRAVGVRSAPIARRSAPAAGWSECGQPPSLFGQPPPPGGRISVSPLRSSVSPRRRVVGVRSAPSLFGQPRHSSTSPVAVLPAPVAQARIFQMLRSASRSRAIVFSSTPRSSSTCRAMATPVSPSSKTARVQPAARSASPSPR